MFEYENKIRKKVQGVPQSQAAANSDTTPRGSEKEQNVTHAR